MFDRDQFEERAAIHEFDGGLSRFEAETLAAKSQGFTRWEAMNAIGGGNPSAARDQRSPGVRDAANNLPGMQRGAETQDGPMPKRDVQAGRSCLELLALRT